MNCSPSSEVTGFSYERRQAEVPAARSWQQPFVIVSVLNNYKMLKNCDGGNPDRWSVLTEQIVCRDVHSTSCPESTSGDHSQGQVSVKFLIGISIQGGLYMLIAKHFITQTTLVRRRGWDFLV